jgi:hypothetical protein
MRCSTQSHTVDWGLDWHARTLSRCLFNQGGAILLHRQMKAAPEPSLQAMAPDRGDLAGCVEGLFPWDLAG